MHALFATRPGQKLLAALTQVARALFLLMPGVLILVASLRTEGPTRTLLWLGAGFQAAVCLLHFLTPRSGRQPLAPALVTLNLIGLGWLWICVEPSDDWFLHLAQALLLIVPLTVFALQALAGSRAPAIRRARVLAQRLAQRPDWPADLAACRALPEVKALREALHVDATPALELLHHPRLEVRLAALAALEFYKNWRPGQADMVLLLARTAPEPAVRAAAINALANLDNRPTVELLAEFLRDPVVEIRRAACEAVLWDCERRWKWVRSALRCALSDPICQDDGPVRFDMHALPREALADLHAWATERGILAVRAALTLGTYYAQRLAEGPEKELVRALQAEVADPHTPATLRMELAQLLRDAGQLDHELLEQLVAAINPVPLRLLAVEALLDGDRHPGALAALHDIARLPNREIALLSADIIQRRLGVDMGLPLGQPLPPIQSRQAAEVTRQVMLWAAQQEQPTVRLDELDTVWHGERVTG